jgi:apolipoprotein D and lipocalin family protein
MKTGNKILFGSTLIAAGATALLLKSRSAIPKNVKAIENFDVERYLGTWYEIARFDYSFERNIDNAIAQYSLGENGIVKVRNSGFNYKKGKWISANGIAKFRQARHIAALKVSFFGPFYAGYNVVALEDNYQYALVVGRSLKYLWILSRTKDIPEKIKKDYLRIAAGIGYDTSKLIWVKHNKINPYVEKK